MTKTLEDILKDNNLTKEEKVHIINQYYDNYRSQINKELAQYLVKQYAGAALEIGSAALPMGGVGKIGETFGKQLLKKQLGRKISGEIGAGALSGAASGGLFGLGDSLLNETNPVLTVLKDTVVGGVLGATLGSVGSNIQRTIKGQQLKNYGNIDNLDDLIRKQYNNESRKFYQNYIQGIELNKNGSFDFSKRGVQEQLRWNPHQAQNFPELVKDLKKAQRLPDEPNIKPEQKPHISHYEVYRGKNGDHYIELGNDGYKRYYITKDTPQVATHTASTDDLRDIKTSLESPKYILPPVDQNYIPQMANSNLLYGHVEINVDKNGITQPSQDQSDLFGYTNPLTGSNHIYTREEVGSMSSEEFAKHEKEIMAQVETMDGQMPTNGDLQRESMFGGGVVYVNSYTRSDGTKVKGYYRSR